MIEFKPFPKIFRLNREIVVTEKIDGTNSQIHIQEGSPNELDAIDAWHDDNTGTDMVMFAGSRNRWLTAEKDNFGFAKWAIENKIELRKLGAGTHFGEWWGTGIQRGYGVPKTFSLFNVARWGDDSENRPKCCSVVPILYQGLFDQAAIKECVERLRSHGSLAAPGFMKPEGIVIFHTQGNFGLKVTLEKDEKAKGEI